MADTVMEQFNFIAGTLGLIPIGDNRAINPGMVRRATLGENLMVVYLLNEIDPVYLSFQDVSKLAELLHVIAQRNQAQQEAIQNAQIAAAIQQGIIPVPGAGKRGKN